MFIKSGKRGYTRHGEQWARGPYLMIFINEKGMKEMRACVRIVTLKQLGHWMMGEARLGGLEISLSGPIGHDGLPLDSSDAHRTPQDELWRKVWDRLVPLPEEVAEAYRRDDGWNSVGKAAPVLQEWALANLKALTKPMRL